jgi:branched-chain amino acid transport system substrate-binding protein
MQHFIDAGYPAVLGEHFSGTTLGLAPIANERRRVLLTPCSTNYRLRNAGPWVFRILPTDYDQAVQMARYGRGVLHADRAAVLMIQNAYGQDLGQTFIESFTRAGGKIVYQRRFVEGEKEFGGFINDLLDSNAQFLFLVGHTQEMVDLLRTKYRKERDRRVQALPVLGTDGMYDDTFVQDAGPAAEGVVLASAGFNPQSNDPAVQRFVTAYRARYNRNPNLWAAGAYDSVLVIADAIRRGGNSPEAMRVALTQTRNLPGATGMNTIDGTNGMAGKPVYTFVVKQGSFQPLSW